MSVDRDIARLAHDQLGLVSVQQIRDLGGSRRHLERRVRSGLLEQRNPGVFQLAGCAPTWESRVLASVLAAGPGAIASHFTAAALWDLDGFPRRGRPELSVPRGRYHRPDHSRCHESTDIARCQVVVRSGVPCTDLGRTVLDTARFVGLDRLDRIVENARRLHHVPVGDLVVTLFDHARQGRHGIRRLRAVLDRHLERDVVTDSEFEMLVLSLLAEQGFPPPLLHHEIHSGDVLIAEVDLAWPHRRVAVELHGQHHRVDRKVWEADQVKLVELSALGWDVLPFTWQTYLHCRAWMLRRIRNALSA